jgi:hypothetical protein
MSVLRTLTQATLTPTTNAIEMTIATTTTMEIGGREDTTTTVVHQAEAAAAVAADRPFSS